LPRFSFERGLSRTKPRVRTDLCLEAIGTKGVMGKSGEKSAKTVMLGIQVRPSVRFHPE
jgi:hypothetical protein